MQKVKITKQKVIIFNGSINHKMIKINILLGEREKVGIDNDKN